MTEAGKMPVANSGGMMEFSEKEAREFFAELTFGEHHFLSEPRPFGYGGWIMTYKRDMATFDFDELTRLVFLAHDHCIRAQVMTGGPRGLRIAIWKREREGGIARRHPTLDQAMEKWRKLHPVTAAGNAL